MQRSSSWQDGFSHTVSLLLSWSMPQKQRPRIPHSHPVLPVGANASLCYTLSDLQVLQFFARSGLRICGVVAHVSSVSKDRGDVVSARCVVSVLGLR